MGNHFQFYILSLVLKLYRPSRARFSVMANVGSGQYLNFVDSKNQTINVFIK